MIEPLNGTAAKNSFMSKFFRMVNMKSPAKDILSQNKSESGSEPQICGVSWQADTSIIFT
ncbi:MAG TPA: hypothetical protein DEB10_08260 [Ruminococcaceae bacterium]|nr:hypothetical protein [Oscillospiraceae bacterium]